MPVCFRSATTIPLIAEPEVYDPIDLNDTVGFLILMSFGLFKSLKDAKGSEDVNRLIASMTAKEFQEQSTLNGVAQAVVDKVVRIHHDTYMTCSDARKELCETRKDITLLVRNFNYPLPNAANSPLSSPLVGVEGGPATPPFPVGNLNIDQPLSVEIPNKAPPNFNGQLSFYGDPTNYTNSNTYRSTFQTYSSTGSSQSGDGSKLFSLKKNATNPLDLDADGRIQSYVDFTDFFKIIEGLTDEEREQYEKETELKPAYEPIEEEPSTLDENGVSPEQPANSDRETDI